MANVDTEVFVLPVAVTGVLAAASGAPYVLPFAADLVRVDAKVRVASSGADIIANVAKNGTGLWATTDRLIIASGSTGAIYKAATGPIAQDGATIYYRTPDNPVAGTTGAVTSIQAYANSLAATNANASPLASFAKGDVVQVAIEQVGSTGPTGSDLTVTLTFARK